jgi:Uri superfamily endonuclease
LKAVYVLIIQVKNTTSIKVGSLGYLTFRKGMYAYIGSAQSNFRYRIKRHLHKKKKLFWHIDYFLDNKKTKIWKIFFKEGIKTEECNLARLISKKGKIVLKFGSSDCKCKSHLFQIKECQFLEKNLTELIEKHNAF